VRATWGDPHTVVDIVNGAVAAFLEARRKIDIEAVADTSRILTAFAERERARVEEQLALVAQAKRVAQRRPVPVAAPERARPAPAASAETDAEQALAPLRGGVAEAGTTRADLARQHAAKVAELEARLAERRATRTERHPEVLAIQQALARLAVEPEALRAARAREARLRSEYAALGGRLEDLDAGHPSGAPPRGSGGGTARPAIDTDLAGAAAVAALAVGSRLEADDLTVYQQALLKDAVETYQDLRSRLANVQIELQTAEAAFAYRYVVTNPARVPKKADSPNVAVIVVAAVLAGLFAGVVAAIFAELRSRALLSPRALARQFGLVAAPAQS
jgi:hypothetical protein